MKTLVFTFIISLFLFSCGKEDSQNNPGTDPGTAAQITAAQYANLNQPCLKDASFMTLPTALQLESNYTQYAFTQALVDGVSTFQARVAGLTDAIFPPSTAQFAPVDGFTVFDGDEAYYWIAGDSKYIYRKKNAGYSIYYFEKATDITGSETIYVDQEEDCSDFNYLDYLIDGSANQGQAKLRISYDLSGTENAIDILTDRWETDFVQEKYRFFENGSGQYDKLISNQISLQVFWDPSGNGTYKQFENGLLVDNGIFSF